MKKITAAIISMFILAAVLSGLAGCSGKNVAPSVQTAQTEREAGSAKSLESGAAEETTAAGASGQACCETESPNEDSPASTLQYYTKDDIEALEDTEYFLKSAINHIFNGSVNSQGKGSGYHYDMIEDSDGTIIEGTRSEEDRNGLYTANVEVDGHRKNHYSTFFPDSWSPQQVVDAINEAYEDALSNDRKDGTTWIGYFEDIEIDMYLTDDEKIISAFPVYETDRH